MIYLDYAATTPLDPRAEAAMAPFARAAFGNPSSLHAAGRAARAALDGARDTVADWLGCSISDVIFTSGGTESDNLALKGAARALRSRGTHVITTAVEHHAVLESCAALTRDGFQVTYLSPDRDGLISPDQVAAALTPETILVSVMMANNEIGTIQPIAEIGRLCRARRVVFHTDAVQAAGELPVRVRELSVDLLTVSAHKLYGPKGVGALYARGGTRLQPLLDGGGQEHERRAGTENVAGIVGFAEALRGMPDADEIARLRARRDRLLDGLLAIPDSRLHGSRSQRLANNANVAFAGVAGETLVLALDLEGIAAGTGAACAAGAVEPSHVIQALGYDRVRAREAVRFSLGRGTTAEEIDRTVEIVRRLVSHLRRHGGAERPTDSDGCAA
ncbi:MAG TPA: cysteine desulfurase family protein [Armatimonadota bacterium]|nr:cysteine desulfurase family protein [Armatimonadota bacterium]